MKRNERLQTAVDRLASLTEGGHLLASTDPATLINTVVDKYLELRAKAAKWDKVEQLYPNVAAYITDPDEYTRKRKALKETP